MWLESCFACRPHQNQAYGSTDMTMGFQVGLENLSVAAIKPAVARAGELFQGFNSLGKMCWQQIRRTTKLAN